jgi:hypothetical protein
VAEQQYGDPVADRFRGKTCVLCGTRPSVGVGEHVVSKWFKGDIAQEGPFKSENAGVPYTNRDGDLAIQETLPVPHAPMCVECNGRLNTFLEEPARPVIRKLIPQSPDHKWPTITAEEAAALGKWLLKVCLLWGHPDSDDDNPRVATGPDIGRFTFMEPEWFTWLRDCVDPPDGFTVYVSRRDPLSLFPWTGPVRRIELPSSAVVDGREVRFMKRDLGMRGLDITVVWHPGWSIEHPLVAEGRAAVLWPNPAAVDFAQLGEVREGEISIVAADDTAGAT